MNTQLEYCQRCGNPVPPDCLREKNGFMLCTVGMKCYYERESFPDDYCDFADDYEHDLFETMSRNFRPDDDY